MPLARPTICGRASVQKDNPDPVPDGVWEEAAKHFDEKALGSLVIAIATINAWNRVNVTTAQPAMPPRS